MTTEVNKVVASFGRFTGYSQEVLRIFGEVMFQMGRIAERDLASGQICQEMADLDKLVPYLAILLEQQPEWPGFPERILEKLRLRFPAPDGVDTYSLADCLCEMAAGKAEAFRGIRIH